MDLTKQRTYRSDQMRKMPDTVKIGYRVYKIEDWAIRPAVASDRFGECSHSEGAIRVCAAYGWAKAANTLLHEILHAAWSTWCMRSDDQEERLVDTTANALATIWHDNPAVFDWIRDGLLSGDH